MSSFKKTVKIALVEKGWSQRELARQMGITVSYLQDLLNGNRNSLKESSKSKIY
ncbi:helix-turn-helix domain-containing protein [Enterococcus termitis]